MCSNTQAARFRHVEGVSLIELILFIVIVGVAVAGVLATFRLSVQKSADPLVRKQAIAIAESLLEEVQLMPFTFCDPDDANARAATGAFVGPGGCAATVEALGPEGAETRYATGGQQFDNVNDYHGYNNAAEVPTGIKDISGASVASLAGYNASITITPAALGTIAATDSLRIAVTVTGPGNTTVTLEGYRTRYAPRSTP
jgi:MSHA pilin protein MshD